MRVMKKRILSLFLCLTFLTAAGALGGTKLEVQAANNVTPSKKEYEVELFKGGVYLGNQKGVDVSGGEAVYLTYTVDSVTEDAVKQSGLVATADCSKDYPYVDGIMQYHNQKNLLMKPGYTYFIKFQVTEFGFEYVAVYSNGEDEAYETGFLHTTGELKDNLQYCGIWLGGKIIAYLTHVRCYDAKGNDLGLAVKSGVINDPTFKSNSNVEHSYEFTVTDANEVAVSSSKYSRADEIFMEYEVKDVTNTIKQTGFITTNSPTSRYPFEGNNGYMQFRNIFDDSVSVLAIPGAKYLLRFTREADGFSVDARYTLDGKNYYINFPSTAGSYIPDYGYCSLWYAGGKLSATFYNVRCYDAAGNNLGIQTNQKDVEVIHYGGWEDYSVCEGAYYCSDNNTVITLLEDRSVSVQKLDEASVEGTYRIDERQLTMQMRGQKTEYTYSYIYMTDEAGNRYNRLKEYTVKFVTGADEITRIASMENKYQIETPEEPTMKGNTFLGWYLGDGTEWKVSSITTSSQTVYAKWVDGDGNEYLATGVELSNPEVDMTPVIVVSICAVIVLLTTTGIFLVLKKGRKHETE